MFWRKITKPKTYFAFRPKADITAHELAVILKSLGIGSRVAFTEENRASAGELMRHFEPHEDKHEMSPKL